MSRLNKNQLQDKLLGDNHLDPASMLDQLRQLSAAGGTTVNYDPDGRVSGTLTLLQNGDTRVLDLIRDINGNIISIHISFVSSPLVKTYNVVRDPDGQILGVNES